MFFFVPEPSMGYYTAFDHNVSLDSFGLWHFLRLALFLMTLAALQNTDQEFYRFWLDLDLFDVFLMIRLVLWVLEGRPQCKVPFPSHNIKGPYCQHDLVVMVLTSITWPRLCFPAIPITMLPFSLSRLFCLVIPHQAFPTYGWPTRREGWPSLSMES